MGINNTKRNGFIDEYKFKYLLKQRTLSHDIIYVKILSKQVRHKPREIGF
ncbi:hypothetical protein SDC9_122378 [bioreactor metagenome]|uniref:Uncharacterized protein n=1 Tax=bioreactor metagenome TaxID=1076179 RepID=A0A645CEI8_9ZZZZ